MKPSSGQASRVAIALALTLTVILSAARLSAEVQGVGPDLPGSTLKPGAKLTYGSGGRDQPPWTIDSVHQAVSLGGRSGCTRIYLRMRPDQPAPTARVVCRAGDTLFAWNATTSEWRADRPLGAGMTLRVPQPSGATLDYETAAFGDTTISGHRLAFVRTTILTRDAQGHVTRRLRERYSVALATALGGVFEVPDSVTTGWRESQRFELVRVEIP